MKNQQSKIKYEGKKYEVVPHNPEWLIVFEKEAKDLKEIFGSDAIEIEHIGSTSVPSLESKPTVDILVTVDDIEVTNRHLGEMESRGYKYLGEYVMPGSRLFVKEREGNADRLFNVHIFPKDHKHVKEMIGLRDYFRGHPEEVEKYAELKKELATKYPNDYAQYRKLKDEYIEDLKKRVLDLDRCLAAKKFWPPARARRKGGCGGNSVAPERSAGAKRRRSVPFKKGSDFVK